MTELSLESKAARHAEIDRRYGAMRRDQKKRRYSVAALRLGELYRLARHWWGPELPDDDVGRVFVRVVCNHLAGLTGDPYARMASFVELWAPWLDDNEFDEISELADQSPTRYSADRVANAIGLTFETRQLLQIKTIGAVDCPKVARDEIQRVKHRDRETRRRAAKRKKRPPPLSEVRPWEAIGISRSSFYRHRELYESVLFSREQSSTDHQQPQPGESS